MAYLQFNQSPIDLDLASMVLRDMQANPDQSRTYVGIYLHENRLYIFDATVAKGMPPPLIFQQSPEFLDAEGNSIRYRTYYFNRLPEPRLGGRGAGAPPGAGGPQGASPGGGGPIQRGRPPQQ